MTEANIIKTVRNVMPARPVNLGEAYILAERQATLLLKLLDITQTPVDVARIADLPKIEIRVEPRHRIPTLAGFSRKWENGRWLIVINRDDPQGRRRFTLAHEFKHVLDHTIATVAYSKLGFGSDDQRQRQVERICDHFAACLLMPRTAVKRVWASGVQDIDNLAGSIFNVSVAAMTIRLRYLGLIADQTRPVKEYFRSLTFDIPSMQQSHLCLAT
jgi:Zn-dependent peptidase ImmA (M78 family)